MELFQSITTTNVTAGKAALTAYGSALGLKVWKFLVTPERGFTTILAQFEPYLPVDDFNG